MIRAGKLVPILVAIVLCLSPRQAHPDFLPTPGLTLRTNSQDCINKFRSMHTLFFDYFNGVDAYASLNRLDVLTGGVVSTDAGQVLPVGAPLNTQMYAVSSTYGSVPAGNTRGKQELEEYGLYGPGDSVNSELRLTVNDKTFWIIAEHDDCAPATLAKSLRVQIKKTWNVNDPNFNGGTIRRTNANIYLHFNRSDGGHSCGDLNRKISDVVSSKIQELQTMDPVTISNNGGGPISDADIDTEAKITTTLQTIKGICNFHNGA